MAFIRDPSTRGFTLIELLVVVAVIALLIAILVPSLGKAREASRKAYCQSNLKQWGTGYNLYADSYDDILPFTGHGDGNSGGSYLAYWDDPWYWSNGVLTMLNSANQTYFDMQNAKIAGTGTLPTIGSKSIFVCPSVTTMQPGNGDQPLDGNYFQMYGIEPGGGTVDSRDVFWCYVTNSKIDNTVSSAGIGINVSDAQHPQPVFHPRIKRSRLPMSGSEVPYLVEKMMSPNELNPPYTDSIARGKTTWTRLAARHNGGGNIGFVDGHAEWFSYAYLSTQTFDTYGSVPGLLVWDPFLASGP